MSEPISSLPIAAVNNQMGDIKAVELSSLWRKTIVSVVLLIAWILWLYWGTVEAMVTIWWRSETFTHGFLVVPIVLWLVWRARPNLVFYEPTPSITSFAVVALVAFTWLMGDLVAVNAVTQLALVTLLVLVVPALMGFTIAGQIVFPLAFMYFAVPIGEFFMPQLMEWTADFTVAALRLTGIPVFREGLQFVIPSGNWSVVEACSGIRYLIASMTVGTLFAYLNYRSTKKRAIFFLVSVLVPILANWLRAYMIVMLGHLSNNKLAAGVDHLIYGWVFFGIVIMLMFIIGARWAEPDAAPPTKAGNGSALSAKGNEKWNWMAAVAFGVLVALPHLAEWSIRKNETSAQAVFSPATLISKAWQATPQNRIGFKPTFVNPSAEFHQEFENGDQVVGIYLGYYRNQTYDKKLVTSENVMVSSSDLKWAQIAKDTVAVAFDGQVSTFRTAELRNAPISDSAKLVRLTVWHTYWVGGRLTSSDHLAKVYSALDRLLGRGDESSVIVLYANKGQNGEQALDAFIAENSSGINAMLKRTARAN
jgi:exosortase A